MKNIKQKFAEKLAVGAIALIGFVILAVLLFFLFNGITAGIIYLVFYYGLLPLFPSLSEYALSFWQMFWIVAILRCIKSIFTTNTDSTVNSK